MQQGRPIAFWKADIDAAYRRVPIDPGHRWAAGVMFKYDGATFVKEHKNKFWEVASFIHDWLNVIGYVGKKVDLYFIKIMISLNYSENIIFERCKWMQFTWINKLRHKLKRTYISDSIPIHLPN